MMQAKMQCLTILAILAMTRLANAGIVFESATLGPTGPNLGGVYIGDADGPGPGTLQYYGARFSVAASVNVTSIGGHFDGNGSIFGAIVSLTSAIDFPNSLDLTSPDVLGTTLLTLSSPSQESFGDLALTLGPGNYAVIFGSGSFGATGSGLMPLNNTAIGSPTFIFFRPGVDAAWKNDTFSKTARFVVLSDTSGTVPEPAAFAIWVGLGLVGIGRAGYRRLRRVAPSSVM